MIKKLPLEVRRKKVIEKLLELESYSEVAKVFGMNSQNVKSLVYTELQKIIPCWEWESWLLPGQQKFKDIKLYQLVNNKHYIFNRIGL